MSGYRAVNRLLRHPGRGRYSWITSHYVLATIALRHPEPGWSSKPSMYLAHALVAGGGTAARLYP
jgi:hypothetical protein